MYWQVLGWPRGGWCLLHNLISESWWFCIFCCFTWKATWQRAFKEENWVFPNWSFKRIISRNDQFQFGVLKRVWFTFIIDLSVWSVHLPSWHNLGLHCMMLMILLSTWRMQCHCYRNCTRNRDLNMYHLFYKNVQCGNAFAKPEAISLRHEMNICCLRAFRLTLKKRKDSTSRQILSQ